MKPVGRTAKFKSIAANEILLIKEHVHHESAPPEIQKFSFHWGVLQESYSCARKQKRKRAIFISIVPSVCELNDSKALL